MIRKICRLIKIDLFCVTYYLNAPNIFFITPTYFSSSDNVFFYDMRTLTNLGYLKRVVDFFPGQELWLVLWMKIELATRERILLTPVIVEEWSVSFSSVNGHLLCWWGFQNICLQMWNVSLFFATNPHVPRPQQIQWTLKMTFKTSRVVWSILSPPYSTAKRQNYFFQGH